MEGRTPNSTPNNRNKPLLEKLQLRQLSRSAPVSRPPLSKGTPQNSRHHTPSQNNSTSTGFASPDRTKRRPFSTSPPNATSPRVPIPRCSEAWVAFSEHIRQISSTPPGGGSGSGVLGETKQSFASSMSDTHATVLRHMKDQLGRRRLRQSGLSSFSDSLADGDPGSARGVWRRVSVRRQESSSLSQSGLTSSVNGMMMTTATEAVKEEDAAFIENQNDNESFEEYYEEDEDSDAEDEETEAMRAKRRKEAALAHWAIVRRYVDDKRRERRSAELEADKSWLVLRAQLRALTRAAKVKEDLYVRYGVMPERGRHIAVNVMSAKRGGGEATRIRGIVERFESLRIRKMPALQI